jgi:hypothetical protein
MKINVNDLARRDLEKNIGFFKRIFILSTIFLSICLIIFIGIMIRRSQLVEERGPGNEFEITSENNGEELFYRRMEIEEEIRFLDSLSRLLIMAIIFCAILTPVTYSKMKTFSILLASHLEAQSISPANKS